MSAEENQSVTEEVAQPTEAEQPHNNVSQEASQAEQKKRNDAEYNWAEMRRQMKEKDQQIEELRNKFSKFDSKGPKAEEDDELAKLAEDDILTVAQARKLATKMARSVAEDVVKQREASTVEERVNLKFPDYSEVVSRENIELLKQTEPELAQSLYHMPDPYSQAVAAYKLLKKIAEKKEVPNALERKKVAENSQKPVSVNSVTKSSAIGNAHMFENGLTPELKAQLWKEMEMARKSS